jgi:acyl-CoA reductase-like NAD-dependent aldehyde dehydrogenase
VVVGRQDVSGRAYEVFCPFDRELLVAQLVAADKKAVRSAVQSAKAALPGWAGLHWKDRVQAMRSWAAEINKRKYDLALAALYEVGKSRIEAIGEAEEAVDPRGTSYSQQSSRTLPPGHWISREELFLPFLSVHPMQSLAEGIACGNQTIYGLTAGIYSEEDMELNEFFRTAEAGVRYANRPSGATTGAWPGFQTFCGWKGSGVDGKGGLGPYTIPRYLREQGITIMHRA